MSSEPPRNSDPSPLAPPSRRRFGWIALLAVAAMSSAVAGGAVFVLNGRGAEVAATMEPGKAQYQCPMHPTIVRDHPGECPICGMKLVKMKSGEGGGSGADSAGARKLLYYRSPMNPAQTSPTPRKDEMGMDYVPVYSDELGGESSVEGQATVNIDPARQQLLGLKTVAATRGMVGGAWRTVGRVAVDETRVRRINLKITGYVERIYVDFVGKPVSKGEALFSVYSPELLSAQEEFLLALRTQKTLARGGTMASDGNALFAAARRKLELWDVPESEIRRLEQTEMPTKTLTFHSPIAGVVTKKDVVEGMKLDAGAMPYEIVDLSRVWVLADVYESELRHVKVGMAATLTLKAFPNRVFKGKVSFIDPLLDPMTRTVKVRVAFPNPDGELRPDMFGEVILQGAAREGLRIPADAIIESGTKSIVFVSLGEGKFQPREVETGDRFGSEVEIVAGLSEAEAVVSRANFLLDSESRLRASLAARGPGGSNPTTGGHDHDAGRAAGVPRGLDHDAGIARSPAAVEPSPPAPAMRTPEHTGHAGHTGH